MLSPYSIQSALAMTYAGADGQTRAEMAEVLRYPDNEADLHAAFAALRQTLTEMADATVRRAATARERGETLDPIRLTIANQLFGQSGYEFRAPFLDLVASSYQAPLQSMDFIHAANEATKAINSWVEQETSKRIVDLIPPDALDEDTRLVLVNAIHLKAPWAQPFSESATRPQPFHIAGGRAQDVSMMQQQGRFGFRRHDGFSAITIPYLGGELQFLILLPDKVDGLADLEAKLTPELLSTAATPGAAEMILQMPKFKLEPPVMPLGQDLQALGMHSAFDQPTGSANFDRMAPRQPNDYLRISEVFHKTFLELDEKGTEAAAATAVAMVRVTSALPEQPVQVRVDRPFLFALQHRSTAACLFLGRLVDPR